MTDDEIVTGYAKHVETGADEHVWPWEPVTEPIDADPERAWRVLRLALPRCPSLECVVGAGPLEDDWHHHLLQSVESVSARVPSAPSPNPMFFESQLMPDLHPVAWLYTGRGFIGRSA